MLTARPLFMGILVVGRVVRPVRRPACWWSVVVRGRRRIFGGDGRGRQTFSLFRAVSPRMGKSVKEEKIAHAFRSYPKTVKSNTKDSVPEIWGWGAENILSFLNKYERIVFGRLWSKKFHHPRLPWETLGELVKNCGFFGKGGDCMV